MSTPVLGHGLTGIADAGAFLARLARLDPSAVVRLRSAGSTGRTTLWARLPWTVLVSRTVAGGGPGDATVSAALLLAELERAGTGLPPRRDPDWRWPLPGSAGRLVETMAGAEVRRIAAAAAGALRSAADHGVAGRAVGQRAVRDALLDHVAVVVTESGAGQPPTLTAAGVRIEVSQRLVQGVVRMGFLGPAEPFPSDRVESDRVESDRVESDRVQVRVAGRWTGLSAPYGAAWSLDSSQLSITPT